MRKGKQKRRKESSDLQEEQQKHKANLERRIYSLSDLEEQNDATAPSLDLRQLNVEKLYMPKDGGKYMLFYVSVKKDARPEECKFCGARSSLTFSGKSELRVIHDRMRENYRRDIILYPPRLHCKSCAQRYVMPIEGIYDSHAMTVHFKYTTIVNIRHLQHHGKKEGVFQSLKNSNFLFWTIFCFLIITPTF